MRFIISVFDCCKCLRFRMRFDIDQSPKCRYCPWKLIFSLLEVGVFSIGWDTIFQVTGKNLYQKKDMASSDISA